MPIRISVDPNKIGIRVQNAWKEGLAKLSEEILADCNEYTKKDQNTLIMSSQTASRLSEGIIAWDTVYAKRQYYEIKTSLTPGRTWKWCETAKRKHKREWQELAERLLRENL